MFALVFALPSCECGRCIILRKNNGENGNAPFPYPPCERPKVSGLKRENSKGPEVLHEFIPESYDGP